MAEWHGVVAGIPGSVTEGNPLGSSIEGRFAVASGWVFVEDSAGNRIGARQLLPDENPRAAARGILRTTRAGGGDPYAHLFYSKKGSW
jgi:hypothetical protein